MDALAHHLHQTVVPLWHKDDDLSSFTTEDVVVLPGGFSYGDYLRCGAIAKFSPMMKSVIRFANEGGKVLGVCNGFQILCESGLLPGALLRNERQQFICKNIWMKNDAAEAEALKIPIAHGEGRFYATDEQMADIQSNNQVLYRYCTPEGVVIAEANPNGSLNNIAGICNKNRNVFGMMPHPERACDPRLGNLDGVKVFKTLFPNLNN